MKKMVALSLCAITALFADEYSVNLNQANLSELRAVTPIDIYSGDILRQSSTLGGFLSEQTSMTVVPSYGNPFSPIIDMRGFGMEQGSQDIAVILNGQKLNNVDGRPVSLIAIPQALLERVEIERGGGSVEYGNNAVAGSVVLKTRQIDGVEAGIEGGNYNQGMTYGAVGSKLGFIKATLYSDFVNAPAEQQFSQNGMMNKSSSKNLWFLAETEMINNWTVRFQKNLSQQYIRYPSYLTNAQFSQNPAQIGAYPIYQTFYYNNTGAGATYLGGNWALDFNGWFNNQSSMYSNYSPYTYNNAQFDATIKANISGYDLSLGANATNNNRLNDGSFAYKTARDIFAKAKYNLSQNSFNAGIRGSLTNYSFGQFSQNVNNYLWSAELGYNYSLNSALSGFTSYSRAYLTPNLDAFYNYVNYQSVFNGYVKPQTSNTINVGSIWIDGKNNAKATLFFIDLQNEIYYQPTSAYSGYNTNIPTSQKLGADLSGKYYALENLNFLTSISVVRPTITSGTYQGKTLPGVSPFSGSFGACYKPISSISVDLTEKYQSPTYAYGDFANANPGTQKAYSSTDAKIAYNMKNIEFYAKANNLFGVKNGVWTSQDSVYPSSIVPLFSAGLTLKY